MNTAKQLRGCAAFAAGVTVAFVMCGSAFAQDGFLGQAGPEEMAATQVAFRGVDAQPGVLPQSVLESAASYRFYMRSAGGIDAGFTNGASVARSLRLGAAYEPRQLARGAVAYAAVVALQDERFIDHVRRVTANPAARRSLTDALLNEPQRAAMLPGADRAAGRISAALSAEGGRVRETGLRVKQAAYTVQHQSWSKGEVSGRVERLAETKTLSLSTPEAPADELRQLVSYEPVSLPDADRTSVVARGLALAALTVMGEADDSAAKTLMNDQECAYCLRMSKLNLFQCLAVAKPNYEDVFCLGQHGLIDTGDCIYAASGAGRAPKPVMVVAAPARRDEDEEVTRIALN